MVYILFAKANFFMCFNEDIVLRDENKAVRCFFFLDGP